MRPTAAFFAIDLLIRKGTTSGEFQYDIPIETSSPHGGKVNAHTRHKIVARIAGLGFLGSDLSKEAGLCLQANSNAQDIAQSYHKSEALLHSVLGEVHVALLSRYLILYGFLACQIELPELAEDITLVDVKVVLVQHITLTSMDDPTLREIITPFEIPLWRMSKSQAPDNPLPRRMRRGERFHLCENAIRLPSDNTTRQSTSQWSNTGIRISHKLKVLIRYIEEEREKETKELAIAFAAPISSCK